MLSYSFFKKAPILRLEINIPVEPPQWDTKRDPTSEDIEFMKMQLANEVKDCRISKHDRRLQRPNNKPFPCGIMIVDKDYYAVGPGLKQNKQLGKGLYGVVKLVRKLTGKQQGQFFALKAHIKILKKREGDSNVEHIIHREFEALNYLNRLHSSLITYGEKVNFLMDFEPGKNLNEFLLCEEKAREKLSPLRYLDIILNILKATDYLHNCVGILHGDLKPENIIFDSVNNRIKIVDFGVYLKIGYEKTASSQSRRYAIKYRAPEIESAYAKHQRIAYTPDKEVYALGVIFQELTGSATIGETKLKNTTVFTEDQEIQKYLQKMISRARRPTLAEAIQFFEKYRENYVKTIGVMFVKDYVRCDEASKNMIIQQLSDCGEVYLMDEMKKNRPAFVIHYASIREELEKKGILVANQVYVSSDLEYLENVLPRMIAGSRPIEKVRFVTPPSTPSSTPPSIQSSPAESPDDLDGISEFRL